MLFGGRRYRKGGSRQELEKVQTESDRTLPGKTSAPKEKTKNERKNFGVNKKRPIGERDNSIVFEDEKMGVGKKR